MIGKAGFDKTLLKRPKGQVKLEPEWPPIDLTVGKKQIRIKILRDANLKRGREIEGSIYPNRVGGWQSSKEFFCTFTAVQYGTYVDIRFRSGNRAFSTENMRASRRITERPTQYTIAKIVADAFAVLIEILDQAESRNKIPF